jgi:hypothetical protein
MKKIFLLLLIASLFACKDEPEQIPAYLNLQPYTVTAPGGASWQKITDGWLYINGEFLGAYTLPATVPVLAEGETEVILFPGVKENGIANTPNIYPYLTRFTKMVTLSGGQTTEFKPSTDYDNDATFAFGIGRGDFDGGSFIGLENRDSDDSIQVKITTDGALAGQCVLMQVDTAHPVMDIATEEMENVPILGAPEVWLELHYRCDMPFFLTLLSGPTEIYTPVFQFNPAAEWNKIYINLTGTIAGTQQSVQRLFFRLSLPRSEETGNYSQNSGFVLLDNIRVLHY